MRQMLVGTLTAAAAYLALAAPALSADQRNITFYNATGFGIRGIYISEPDQNEFDENELDDILHDGQTVYIEFSDDDEGCRWDIKIDWQQAGFPSPLLRNVDLCNINDIRLIYDTASGVTSYQTR